MLTMCEWISLWLWHILNQDLINKLGKYKKSFNFHSAIHENPDNWYLRRSCLNKFWKLPVMDWDWKCANGAILVKLVSVSSEQKVPLVMFANIVCSSVSRNAGLGGGVGGTIREGCGPPLGSDGLPTRLIAHRASVGAWSGPPWPPPPDTSCQRTITGIRVMLCDRSYNDLLDID